DDASSQKQRADRVSFAHERNAKGAAKAATPLALEDREFRIGQDIGNLDRPAFKRCPSADRRAIEIQPPLEHKLLKFGREAVGRDHLESVVLQAQDSRLVRAAELSSGLDERLEHGLQVEGRAADDLEHIGGGGLLLQGFGQIARLGLYLIEQ